MKLSSMKKAKSKKGNQSPYLLHFTSIEAFLGMLSPWMNSGKKKDPYLTFHATVFSKMNDAGENKIIYDNFFTDSEWKNQIKTQYENYLKTEKPYVISFVRGELKSKIDIPMWLNYGKGATGIYLRFDLKKLNEYYKGKENYRFDKCQYVNSQDKKDKIADLNLYRRIGNFDILFDEIKETSIFLKDKCWEYENEWRIVKFEKDENAKQKITPRGVIEYTETTIPLNTLSKIHIGPKANKEWCEQTLEVILAKIKDYNCSFDIEISNLKIQ